MHVGVCRVTLHLPENHSLKDKRQVLKSLTARLKNRFNVSVAEIDNQDVWQTASVGIVCVSNDIRHIHQVLSNVMAFIEDTRLDAQVWDYQTEVIQAL
ncbi:MAG: DUF503 domain-containing protein [Chloroflexi bacterium]|nr:DUF503 domain-containing protein [Chloroflexota bacterium]